MLKLKTEFTGIRTSCRVYLQTFRKYKLTVDKPKKTTFKLILANVSVRKCTRVCDKSKKCLQFYLIRITVSKWNTSLNLQIELLVSYFSHERTYFLLPWSFQSKSFSAMNIVESILLGNIILRSSQQQEARSAINYLPRKIPVCVCLSIG